MSLQAPLQVVVPAFPATGTQPAGSVLALPDGEIACELRPLARTSKRAAYELRIVNDTPQALSAFAYAVSGHEASRIRCDAFVVPPFASIAVETELAPGMRAARMVAEVHAGAARLTLDAQVPRGPRGPGRRAVAATVGSLALAALAGFGFAARPRVVALAAPAFAPGGKPFSVAYATRAARRADYAVTAADGTVVAGAPLPPGEGGFSLDLPAGAASRGYDVRVSASGRLGQDLRIAHVVVPAVPASPAPPAVRAPKPVQVTRVQVERDPAQSGEPLAVDYRASSATGTVRLIDQQGTVRAEALLNREGRSILIAPVVAADQDLRVVVAAQSGTLHAEAAVPVRLLAPSPAPSPGAFAGDGDGNGGTANAGNATDAGDGGDVAAPVRLARDAFPPGEPLAVEILAHARGLRLTLRDYSGTELAARTVDRDQAVVLFAPPPASAGNRFILVASFTSAAGDETRILPFTIRRTHSR